MQSTKTNCLGFKRIEGVPICFDYVTKRRSSRCQVIMSAQISTSTWQLLYFSSTWQIWREPQMLTSASSADVEC